MTRNAGYQFQNRWRIEGTLTTRSPLHVGSGEITARANLLNEQSDETVEIAAVLTDHRKKPCVSGSALKGNLRSWAVRLTDSAKRCEQIERLFGNLLAEEDSAGGGRLVFENTMLSAAAPKDNIPYYDADRGTGVVARVALHRVTKTAIPQRLFHLEYVPSDTTFNVVIDGQDLSEDDVAFSLALLGGFNADHDPVRLGAEMASGWGRCEWTLHRVRRADAATRTKFLEGKIEGVGYDLCELISASERQALEQQAKDMALGSARALLTLELQLNFDGPFLVNDPSRCKDSKDKENEQDNRPNHDPRLNPDGRVLLPASSVRGAFRTRAEKIVRTLNEAEATPSDLKPLMASESLTFIEEIFGASELAAAVRFTDFTSMNPARITRQEFVAIDRFTGGGAAGLKFNAEHALAPQLTGTVTVNLGRLAPAHLGLLALALRDLIEGDISFGMGWAKGYGRCEARVTGGRLPALTGLADWRDEAEFLGDLSLGTELTNPAATLSAASDALTMMLEKFQNRMNGKGN